MSDYTDVGPLRRRRPLEHGQWICCAELVEIITDYVEETMQEGERRRFEAHLDECPYCANYLEQMRQTIAALGELSAESIAPDAREALLETFRGWRS